MENFDSILAYIKRTVQKIWRVGENEGGSEK